MLAAKFLYICKPALPLFSGWNWHANMLLCTKLEQNEVFPKDVCEEIISELLGIAIYECTKYMCSPLLIFVKGWMGQVLYGLSV